MSRSLCLAFLSLCLFVCATGIASDASVGSSTAEAAAGKSWVVQNMYYALPGNADAVYRWRLHASEVRARLGLAVGRVLRRERTSDNEREDAELPDVIWECEYPNREARAAEVAQLDGNPEFRDVETHMGTLLRRFRRAMFWVSQP